MSKTKKQSARMNIVHFKTLVARYTKQIVSNAQSFIMLLLQVPVMLLILKLIYVKDCFILHRVTDANTTIFVLVFVGAMMGILNSYREITKEREVLSREIHGGLDPVSYVASKLFVLSMIAIFQAACLVGGSFLFVKFNMAKPFMDTILYFVSVLLVIISSSSIGLLISAILKRSESAILPVLLVIICQVVFAQVIIVIKGPAEILSYVVPTRWGMAILGNILEVNTFIQGYSWKVYDEKIFVSLLALLAIIVACYTLTVAIIKGNNRKKKQ